MLSKGDIPSPKDEWKKGILIGGVFNIYKFLYLPFFIVFFANLYINVNYTIIQLNNINNLFLNYLDTNAFRVKHKNVTIWKWMTISVRMLLR